MRCQAGRAQRQWHPLEAAATGRILQERFSPAGLFWITEPDRNDLAEVTSARSQEQTVPLSDEEVEALLDSSDAAS
jgi:hypothetical protein